MFSTLIKSLPVSDTVSQSLLASRSKVERVLMQSKFQVSDLPFLLSPAAESYIELMAQKSRQLTQQRFGNTMQLFIPMYLSNECFNTCTYCGFSKEYKYPRVTLSDDQIKSELTVISQKGFDHILLLTGESPKSVDASYIANAVSLTAQQFKSIGIEVQPLKKDEYKTIFAAGADSLTLYQETYHHESYLKYHLSGIKRQFYKRLDAVEQGLKAGFFRMNLGFLCGLYDWRYDSMSLAFHLDYLMKHYWQAKYSISFPRINDMYGQFKVDYPANDMALVQMICAFRLVFPDVGITLSTRESAQLRDQLFRL